MIRRNDHHYQPSSVHFVGSIGLDTADEVFSTLGRLLGHRLRRIPDGEPGPRRLWISFQYLVLRSNPLLRPDPGGSVRKTSGFPMICLGENVDPDELRFSELGYARDAKGSYLDFCAARDRGDIGKGVRFQVCLPTPMAVVYAFCVPNDIAAIERAYEAAMLREIEMICASIPHDDLCIQWDFSNEMVILDGQPQDHFPIINASLGEIMSRMRRICEPIPVAVEVGIHLCYGDFGAKHFIEPKDAERMVNVANSLSENISHPLNFVHFPVPIGRDDDGYFKPFAKLNLPKSTELYLGLIHAADGLDGAWRRIRTASRFVEDFGVSTECGISRARKPETVRILIEMHASLSAESDQRSG